MKVDGSALISQMTDSQVKNIKESEEMKSFEDALEKAKATGDAEGLKKVSEEFEAFFIRQIFKSMRQSSQWGEGLFEKSHGREMYEGMFDDELANEISKGRGIGIGDMIYKQMSKQYAMEPVSKKDTEENDKTSDNQTKSLDIKG